MTRMIIVMIAFFLSACANQLMKKSILLEPGMTKEELVANLGPPGNRQFKGNKEAWQYCETGGMVDDYVVVWLVHGKVAGTQSYNNSRPGFCSSFFRTVNWEEAPDAVIEFRDR